MKRFTVSGTEISLFLGAFEFAVELKAIMAYLSPKTNNTNSKHHFCLFVFINIGKSARLQNLRSHVWILPQGWRFLWSNFDLFVMKIKVLRLVIHLSNIIKSKCSNMSNRLSYIVYETDMFDKCSWEPTVQTVILYIARQLYNNSIISTVAEFLQACCYNLYSNVMYRKLMRTLPIDQRDKLLIPDWLFSWDKDCFLYE